MINKIKKYEDKKKKEIEEYNKEPIKIDNDGKITCNFQRSLLCSELKGFQEGVKLKEKEEEKFINKLIKYHNLKIKLGKENKFLSKDEKEAHFTCCIDTKIFINELSKQIFNYSHPESIDSNRKINSGSDTKQINEAKK